LTAPPREPRVESHRTVSLVAPRTVGKADPADLDSAPPVALLVDDDPVFRTVIRAYLEDAGFRVEESDSGLHALECFESVEPDIVLLDILMPGMDGFETCTALRRLPGGRQTPVVMMTGVDDRDSIERAYEVGATDFIVKPINAFILTHRLQHILRANRYLVHFDALTGLPKRALFLERLAMAIASARRSDRYVAVFFLGLDDFKRYNDTLGHKVGDQILRRVGERLGELRASDYFARNSEDDRAADPDARTQPVGRSGSDEFMVLLPDIGFEKDIAVVARRVNEILKRPFRVAGEEVCLAASIGVSAYPLDGGDPERLLERAEVAMNHAKRAGRGGYQFYGENLNAKTQARLAIEKDLRRALDHDQLVLQLQPRVDVQHERVAGVEALVRLPGFGARPVAPSDFIPVAEETGLIVPMGDWVFRKACAAFAQLDRAGSPMVLSINLSSIQFRHEGLCEYMVKQVGETGLSPECVELELTESVLLEDADSSVAALTRLKDLGFRISVDDFGTGYSSLSYLKRFPIDVLKIDRSFVRDLPGDHRDCAIVEAIIDLGHKLSLEIVAEGVEHRRQLDFLRQRGCDQVQGYHYSRPLLVDDLAAWIGAWSASPEPGVLETVRESLSAGALDGRG
jgi:predicted signal transduction protein with EAL and GGDEF domain